MSGVSPLYLLGKVRLYMHLLLFPNSYCMKLTLSFIERPPPLNPTTQYSPLSPPSLESTPILDVFFSSPFVLPSTAPHPSHHPPYPSGLSPAPIHPLQPQSLALIHPPTSTHPLAVLSSAPSTNACSPSREKKREMTHQPNLKQTHPCILSDSIPPHDIPSSPPCGIVSRIFCYQR